MAEDTERINWNVDLEVSLFHAMRRHKPVGVNRHFQMVLIHDKLNTSISRKISAFQIWDHLTEMYDLQALNESEILPFPNRTLDFNLPGLDYSDLMVKEFPRMPKEVTPLTQDEVTPTATPKATPKATKETPSTPSSLSKADLAEDSPKREQRKRTRNTGTDQPTKRVRRT